MASDATALDSYGRPVRWAAVSAANRAASSTRRRCSYLQPASSGRWRCLASASSGRMRMTGFPPHNAQLPRWTSVRLGGCSLPWKACVCAPASPWRAWLHCLLRHFAHAPRCACFACTYTALSPCCLTPRTPRRARLASTFSRSRSPWRAHTVAGTLGSFLNDAGRGDMPSAVPLPSVPPACCLCLCLATRLPPIITTTCRRSPALSSLEQILFYWGGRAWHKLHPRVNAHARCAAGGSTERRMA